ncbi:MAG: hypothetical protein M3R69_09960 [Acidobacteriota bacterium]|nr:hypothetical protein [Acidobacteriota bacterium]
MINPGSFLKLCLLACLLATLSACQQIPLPQTAQAGPHSPEAPELKAAPQTNETYGPPTKLGNLADPAINESSGIVASRTSPGLYWTHNDSGDGPFIYAFDNRGARRGVWRVTGADARDWEDIAAGPGPVRGTNYLYIGDIGDNSGSRADVVVYRVPEPAIRAEDAQSTKRKPRATEAAEAIRLRYPDGAHDAEALLVHPVTGNIYIITKTPFADPSIYEVDAPQKTDRTTTLVRVAKLNVPSLLGGIITGGDISPDGRRVALCDYIQGYEIVLPDARGAFNQIWKQPLKTIALGARRQGEGIGYRLDGRALLTTSEGLHSPLNQVVRR